jgi:hypothetical protein
VSDNIGEFFAFFSQSDPNHTKDDDEGLTSLNSIAYLSQFLFPASSTMEIIQSALTDPKVINLSNEHFPPLLLCVLVLSFFK